MSKRNKNGNDGGNKGGFGKKLLLGLILIGAGVGAFWYLAPEMFQEQVVDRLAGLFGS